MHTSPVLGRAAWFLLLTFLGAACAPTKPEAKAPAPVAASSHALPPVPKEPPIVPPPIGSIPPTNVVLPAVGRVLERQVEGDFESLVVELAPDWRSGIPSRPAPEPSLWGQASAGGLRLSRAWVRGEAPSAAGFVLLADSDPSLREQRSGVGPAPAKDLLWLRRGKAHAGEPLSVTFLARDGSTGPAFRISVDVPAPGTVEPSAGFASRFSRALSRYFGRGEGSAFQGFAIQRLGETAGTGRVASRGASSSFGASGAWADLMDLGGRASIDGALQLDSPLRSEIDRHRPTLPFSGLTAPTLPTHPWAEMLSALGAGVPEEPLARSVPAEFYFVRSRAIDELFLLLDEIDSWIVPAVHLLDERLERYDLLERYATELGIERTALSKLLGPELLEEVAVVGSDPFLRQGSDVSLLFRAKNVTLLRAALAATLASRAQGHGAPVQTRFVHEGVPVELDKTADGAVQRYSATAGELFLVSNSRAALLRVIDVIAGKAPALAAEPDFRYMLARDAGVGDHVLAYAGDRFIAEAVSPRSRILDARRQVAQRELQEPALAALLFGWRFGAVPSDTAALTASKLLGPKDLQHFDGAKIEFVVGRGARSSWGTGAKLTPLVELPTPKRITAVESQAYQAFRQRYEQLWGESIDPIALRVKVERGPSGTRLGAKLRVLPVIREREFTDFEGFVGETYVNPGALPDGARAIVAIAADSSLRRDLSGGATSLLGRRAALDWIGSFAALGLLDKNRLANTVAGTDWVPRVPNDAPLVDESTLFSELPAYLSVDVKSRAAAAVLLTTLRARFGTDSGLEFRDGPQIAGVKVTQVLVQDENFSVYYALADRALHVALSLDVMRSLIELPREQAPVSAKPSDPAAGQVMFDLTTRTGGGLEAVCTWLAEKALRDQGERALSLAEELLYGLPGGAQDALSHTSLEYFGAVPVTPDGRAFTFGETGVVDPVRGNEFAPIWPSLPVKGSTIDQVLSSLAALRVHVRFDAEPGQAAGRSFAATVELTRNK